MCVCVCVCQSFCSSESLKLCVREIHLHTTMNVSCSGPGLISQMGGRLNLITGKHKLFMEAGVSECVCVCVCVCVCALETAPTVELYLSVFHLI